MRNLILVALLLCTQLASAQKLYFAKTNYADSLAMEKNMPALAKQVIKNYQEADISKYLDNLFRLQLVAQDYKSVVPTLNQLAQVNFGDSIANQALGFAYRIYSKTLATHPATPLSFSQNYQLAFNTAYQPLSADGQNWASEYFDNDLKPIRTSYASLLKELSPADSLSLLDALRLCRNFCSYKTYTTIQPLARQILAKLENEKFIRNDSVLVKMPDGGTIALTIVRERNVTTPQPVVLKFSIYPGFDAADCKNAAVRGYAGVVANTRGKRLSPDVVEPFEHDAQDAYYIIDWISKQPWCNGKVGMLGGSYLGFAQWAAAKYPHPALKTIVPQVSVAAGIDYPNHNGVFMTYMLRWLHFVMDYKLTDAVGFGDEKKWNTTFADWYKKGSSFRSLDTLEGRPNAIFQRWLIHPGYDSFWQNMTPQQQEFAKINIPIFTTTGYWDDDQTGAMYYYHQYHQWNKNPNYTLLIGPYDHGGSQGYPKRQMGGYVIDSVANVPILEIVFQWFDYILKGKSRPEILKDKVNFEIMGKNEWKHVPSLDKMSNDTLTLYLGNTLSGKYYPLLPTRPAKPGFIAQQVDLKNRSEIRPTGQEISAFPMLLDTLLNPEKERMIFISQPIDKPFAISGALTAAIVASLNKKDMDLVLQLYEQTPDGKYLAFSENIQRASYARDRTKRQLLQPGKTESIVLKNTFITCRQLQKGSRIVVVMGINKSPSWQVNYGTGKDVSDETLKDATVPVDIKWFNSSYIKIPVLR